MNYFIFNGQVAKVPKLCIIPVDGKKQVFACKFVVAAAKEVNSEKYDFYECVAFDKTAELINECIFKGCKVQIMGKIFNHSFKDRNNTPHFTQVVLVEHLECADTASSVQKLEKEGKPFAVIANLDHMNETFELICNEGFLCIDETDYYNIAIDNFIV